MSQDVWWAEDGPMAMCGVQKIQNKDGPEYLIGVVGVLPFEIIPMDVGGFDIIRSFRTVEDAVAEKYAFREAHVHWKRAERNGEATVKIARGLLETPGLRFIYMRPWGLMALGWEDTKEYFPVMLGRMKEVVAEVCGDMEFVDERNITFPNRDQQKVSSKLGINVPI